MLDTNAVRSEVTAVAKARRTMWKIRVLPKKMKVERLIPDEQVNLIWKLNQYALDECGNIRKARLVMDLIHYWITSIACDR